MLRCPLCGLAVPEEDCDVPSLRGKPLVAQIHCRACNKAFTICEMERMIRPSDASHPEDL
jgi:hypothetical protein